MLTYFSHIKGILEAFLSTGMLLWSVVHIVFWNVLWSNKHFICIPALLIFSLFISGQARGTYAKKPPPAAGTVFSTYYTLSIVNGV